MLDTPPLTTLGRSATPPTSFADDRRHEPRSDVLGDLYLIDHQRELLIRCRCLDASEHGMRIHAPLGYGLRPGRTYQLCSHRPGQTQSPGLGLVVSRKATAVWTQVCTGVDELEVGLQLAPTRRVGFDGEDLAISEA